MSIVWTADATKTIDLEWASLSTDGHCGVITYPGMSADANVYQVADATAVHGRGYRAQILTSTAGGCYTSNIREEINQGNSSKNFADGVDRTFHEGQDRWISIQLKLDPSFPSMEQGFKGSSIVQLTHPAGNDGGLYNLNVGYPGAANDQWDIWGYSNTDAGNKNRHDTPLGSYLPTIGKWVRFTFHLLFSSSNNGLFECYSNLGNPASTVMPLLYSKYNTPTIKAGRAYALMTFGWYASKPVPRTIAGNMCGLTVSTDRASAETSAFGGTIVVGSPPVARFTTTPASPVTTGQLVTFDGSASTATTPPLTYAWTDALGGNASLGTKQIQTFTFQSAATKGVTLTVTDGAGLTSSVEHDLVVTAATTTTYPQGDLESIASMTVGNDYFCSATTRLPSNLPTAGFTDFVFAQIDGPPATSLAAQMSLGLTVSGGAIKWCLQRGADYANDIPWTGPTVDNAWHTFILHVKLDTAAAGTGYVAAMTSAVNYWLANGTNLAANTWQNAAFHNGNLAYLATPGATPNTATATWASNNTYTIGNTSGSSRPDDLAAGEVFLKLGQPASIRARVAAEVAAGDHTIWTFIDALNMAMPSYARLGILDASAADLAALHAQFTYTQGTLGLWNDTVGLWWRDATFTSGSTYWSRGNGWAMIGLAKILQVLPISDAGYAEYLRVFKKMAATLLPLQLSNGFWGADLINPSAYGNEASGTAFFTYAIAWGVNAGILDLVTYLPVLTKAWTALSTVALQSGGAVGYIQGATTGAAKPSDGQPVLVTDTSAYGVGGFLLAASEMAKLPGGTGYIELWMDGTKQTFPSVSGQTLAMTTYGSANNGGANWLELQNYRGSGWLASYVQGVAQGGSTTAGTLTTYFATPKIGPSLVSIA